MLTNNIKKGMALRLTNKRKGFMRDNKLGIIRTIKVEVPGHGFKTVNCYINEIEEVYDQDKWHKAEIEEVHIELLTSWKHDVN